MRYEDIDDMGRIPEAFQHDIEHAVFSYGGVSVCLDVHVGECEDLIESFIFNSDKVDDLIGRLFDLSLTHSITRVSRILHVSDRVAGYVFQLKPSHDHQTNITPELLESLHGLVEQSGKHWLADEFVVDLVNRNCHEKTI